MVLAFGSVGEPFDVGPPHLLEEGRELGQGRPVRRRPVPSSAYTWAQLQGTLGSYVENGQAAPLFTST